MIYSKKIVIELYKTMLTIRMFEQNASSAYISPKKIFGTLHLCIGQEAVAAGICKTLRDDDRIVTTHRGHGHMIAKGGDVNQMAAELYGKTTGCCGGKGGSMHISDFSVGSLGANAILGAGFTIAAGSAFASKYLKKDTITVCFFGDGAFSEGSLHEALNICAILKLPVLFVCENNQYALSTPYKKTISTQDLSKIGFSYGIPSLTINGNDVLEVYKTSYEFIKKTRTNPFPMFLECKTYRTCGHYESETEDVHYRSSDEVLYWRSKDPVILFKKYLETRQDISDEELHKIDNDVSDKIKRAFIFAEQSEQPSDTDALKNVYSDIIPNGR